MAWARPPASPACLCIGPRARQRPGDWCGGRESAHGAHRQPLGAAARPGVCDGRSAASCSSAPSSQLALPAPRRPVPAAGRAAAAAFNEQYGTRLDAPAPCPGKLAPASDDQPGAETALVDGNGKRYLALRGSACPIWAGHSPSRPTAGWSTVARQQAWALASAGLGPAGAGRPVLAAARAPPGKKTARPASGWSSACRSAPMRCSKPRPSASRWKTRCWWACARATWKAASST